MDSNTHSTNHPDQQPPQRPQGPGGSPTPDPAHPLARLPDGLTTLTAALDQLAAETEHLDRLPDPVRAERVLALGQRLGRLQGQWLAELAGVDARGAAGAAQGIQAASTAGWLRQRLHLSAAAATSAVRTARAVFRGPLTRTAQALIAGQLSPAHAAVLAAGTHDLPVPTVAAAEPVLLEAARRLDPPRLRRVLEHLRLVVDPEGEHDRAERRHQQRGLWLSPTLDNMVAVDGLLEAEAGQTLLSALEPLARPHSAEDARSGGQRRADALTELARRQLEGGRLPQTGGVRPQLTVLVDLASLQGQPGGVGGVTDSGPLAPEACQRLACDGAVTRVLVTRQPEHPGGRQHPGGCHGHREPGSGHDPGRDHDLTGWLRTAALLPPVLGGAPSQPLDVGRSTRVVQPAQRTALSVRDGGCVFPGCDRPLAWCEAHHLVPWLEDGPTDLANLALLCRAHHREVHEGGWQLTRGPDGRLTATPPHRRPPRRHPTAA